MNDELNIWILCESNQDVEFMMSTLKTKLPKVTYREGASLEDLPKEDHKPNLLIVDCQLASRDRDKWMKFLHKFNSVPLIVIVNRGEEDLALKCIREGVDDYVFRDDPGRLPFAVRVALDRSDKDDIYQQTSKQLASSENVFYLAVNSYPFPFALIDPLGKINFLNQTATKVFSSKQVIPGKTSINDVFPREVGGFVKDHLDLSVASMESQLFDCKVVLGGLDKYYRVDLVPVVEDREVKQVLSFFYDITEQKNFETDLVVARERAVESDNLKSVFLANLSHEIRTPLNAILGFSEFLQKDNLDSGSRRKFVDIITRSGEQLLSIINDLLEISRIELNQLKLKLREVDLDECMIELRDLFTERQKTLQAARLNFELTMPEHGGGKIILDPVRMKQVFTNLLDNAFKFTPSGEVVFGYQILEQKYIRFFVKDSGIGIPREKQLIIFERFRQVEESDTRRYGGNGLGLSICKALVELMGGEIGLVSTPGQGSEFYFILPLKEKEGNGTVKKDTGKTREHNWSGEKILVVEDFVTNYEYLRVLLEVTGAEVLIAVNGKEAMEHIKVHSSIRVVLLDIRLPDIDGNELAANMLTVNPRLKIIAQTANAYEEDRKKALQSGCVGFLAKPIRPGELLKAIESVIKA